MKTKIVYIVFALERTVEIGILHHPQTKIELSWADRMCGAMPVFETKKAAQQYAGKKYSIRKAEIGIKE